LTDISLDPQASSGSVIWSESRSSRSNILYVHTLATFSDVYLYIYILWNTIFNWLTLFGGSYQFHHFFCITKITISLQKDYNYNQIDGYFAWPTSFIRICNLIWKSVKRNVHQFDYNYSLFVTSIIESIFLYSGCGRVV
jgi:hypothetical protein